MAAAKRHASAFKMQRLWWALRKAPGSNPRTLAKLLGWDKHATNQLLYRMARRGYAKQAGCTWKSEWTATGQRPQDQRGLAPNCAKGRACGGKPEHIAKAIAARKEKCARGELVVKRTGPKLLPAGESLFVGKLAIEQLWGLPTFSTYDAQDEKDAA